MKRDLNLFQQTRARAKVFKLLLSLGFQFDTAGGYYWRVVGYGRDQRVCVAFGVPNQCSGGKCEWVWQTAKLNEKPLFGYSGSTHVGAAYGTTEKVIDITLEQFWSAGIGHYAASAQERIKKAKEQVTAALTLVRDAL